MVALSAGKVLTSPAQLALSLWMPSVVGVQVCEYWLASFVVTFTVFQVCPLSLYQIVTIAPPRAGVIDPLMVALSSSGTVAKAAEMVMLLLDFPTVMDLVPVSFLSSKSVTERLTM